MSVIQQEIDSLVPHRDYSRRSFVRTSVGSGFAAAVLPVMAQTQIKTGSDGLLAGEVTIPVGNFKMPAYRAAPANKANPPVILVISEVFGVHEYIADVARRLAKAGYFALAPELFARLGEPGDYGEVGKLLAEVVNQTPDAQVMTDLDAAVAWARRQGAAADKLGITGFCWGGRTSWMYAAHNPALKAGVAWYGTLARNYFATDKSPLDNVARIKAPMLGLYGADDDGIPNDTVEQMRAALKAAGNSKSEIVLFADAPHAFHSDYRPSYRKDQAEDGWKRCLAWFNQHLS